MRYLFNNFVIDKINFKLSLAGTELAAEPQVFDLIIFLIENRSRVVSRDEIFDEVWQGRNVSDTSLSNHIKTARKILCDNALDQNIIKTIRGRGYQFVAEVTEKQNDGRLAPVPSKFFNGFYKIIIVLLFFIVCFLLYGQQDKTSNLIAVLPLTNKGSDVQSDFLGFALADQIIGRLIYHKDIRVRPSAAIRPYDGQVHNPTEIGKNLGVSYILSGNYQRYENKIRLNFELINVDTASLVWREQIELPYGNIFTLQDKVTQKITQRLRLGFGSDLPQIVQSKVSINPIAYEFYLRSLSYPLTKKDDLLAVAMLQNAIKLEGDYEKYHVEMGFRLQRLATFGLEENSNSLKAEEHFLTALRLNHNSLQALEKLAALYTERGQHIKAVQMIEKMLTINPNYGGAFFSLGYIYRYVGLLDRSVRMMEKAAALDEGNTNYQSLGASYYNAGLYQKAIKVFEVKEKTAYDLGFLASVYGRIGEKEKALQNLDLLLAMKAGGFWTSDAKANKAILLGETEKGIIEVQKLENSNISDAEPIYYWASYYAALGDKDGALRLLKKAVQRGYYNLPFMEQDPFWKDLRQDESYLKIMTEVRKKHLNFKAYMDSIEKN